MAFVFRSIGYVILVVFLFSCQTKEKKKLDKIQDIAMVNKEPYRPQYHFTPPEKWMNDPNGLVYHQGVYHLFYQYYPEDIVWGPMHWGHATSKDLLHWEHKPIALYPDEHGYIFSGSAVVDSENTSGFGTKENPALVAIFTYHDSDGERAGRADFQTQGIAYSLDNGATFTKYEGNPVIKNNDLKDFRDPKVFWNKKTKNWTMLLVAGDHLQIWQSENLISWKKVSEFGKSQGAHGGVWECPDLFPLTIEGTEQEKWVLLISINPGAPNGGSGTQYFVGDFDGTTFTSSQKDEKWIDWGTDNYAGVTYNNAPNNERIFIGWMSNWAYARDTPTEKWRSAMTLPRKLALKNISNTYELTSYPIAGLSSKKTFSKKVEIAANAKEKITQKSFNQTEISFTTASRNFELNFKNNAGNDLGLMMNSNENVFVLDRSRSGKVDFQQDFAAIQKMPIPNLPNGDMEVRIFIDWSSIEVFINGGQYVMTAQIFPEEHYSEMVFENSSQDTMQVDDLQLNSIEAVW